MPTQKSRHRDPVENPQKTWLVAGLTAVTMSVILFGFFFTIPYNYRTQTAHRSSFQTILNSVKSLGATIGNGMSKIQTEIRNINAENTNTPEKSDQAIEKERRINTLEEKVFDNIDHTR